MKQPKPINDIRYLVESRMHEVAADLLGIDRRYHDRIRYLERTGTDTYHIDNDIILKNLGGATKVLSDMLAAMSTYMIASDPRRLPGSKL